ncbi:hypothetical protein E1281_28430 [Actinomadura sp. KC345]|uniref:hypothetical protein n=1 Tax=Actinomadura sp. KC345 TaxID=2530371 RepID=UPI00104F5C07|nr:hypothetical protein [Actinomadura sp. KC345]TDC46221.1 hypothetical protein E1281_28430 [Actinomadura sp. KC345]
MIGRSAVKPIFVGLGTAAILAAGGASALADETPSPSPTDTGTTAPPADELKVSVEPQDATVDSGQSLEITTTIEAVGGDATEVKVTNITAALKGTTFAGACGEPFVGEGCSVGDLADGTPKSVNSTVKVPKKGADETTRFTVTATVKAADVEAATGTTTIKYVVPSPSPTKTATNTPDDPPSSSKPPRDKPSPTGSSGEGGGSGGGSGGSDGGGSGGDGSAISDGGAVAPEPNSSFDAQKPEVALPPIQAPSPSVAPNQTGGSTPQSRLQGNEAPVAQDLTFERMASTQIAWLAALLVAFSLLLTQVRLGRRRLRTAGAVKHAKGTHRRPRRGMFGK